MKFMSYEIALNFEDGITRIIRCGSAETVVDAAYRQGVRIPMDCREGACATCKCRVESGRYELGSYVDDALGASEVASGFALACQMRPQSDCVVMVGSSSTACSLQQDAFRVEIAEVQRLSETTFRLVLQGASLRRLAFLPGQYARLDVPGVASASRAYSFSAWSQEGSVAEFLIRNVPGGLMSGYLQGHAKPGAELALTGPFGSFYLRDVQRPVLMLAGGTGLAPFLAMLDRLVAGGGCVQPIHLMYGINTDRDAVAMDRLERFARMLPGFTYEVVVVDANSMHPKRGYVTDHLTPEHLQGGEIDAYLCGPPPMVEAVTRCLHDHAWHPRSFHFERFSASP